MLSKSILIVDDEDLIRLSLKVDLEREGYQTAAAESAESALTLLKERPYDLLLTDYIMEGVDGINLIKEARQLYPEIKVLLFSGFEDENSADGFLKLGADDFFCKPIDFGQLLDRITGLLTS